MGKLRQLWLLTVLAVVAVFVAGYFVLISPQMEKASSVRDDVATAQATNRGLESQIAMLKAQARQLPREQARLAELGKKIPNNPGLPSLIRTLSDNADAASVDLISLSPAKPTTVPAALGSTGVTTGTTAAVQPPTLAVMPLQFLARGHFAELQQFIGSLEDMQRAFLVADIKVTPYCRPPDGGRPPQDCDDRMLTLEIGARVFLTTTTATQLRPTTPVAATEGK